ncbi:RDD family protein [Faecalicoccus pleomorphus]|uniref:RDD family protein n=1 Tax=Faecalicoccus pleomorphus TaxID=1323 RepID=UPI001431BD14|nr:RDD family protein [Faecalicoccus pleomorphus]NJE40925.1 RDD family protein [Faecalicoccus pleomorphus]
MSLYVRLKTLFDDNPNDVDPGKRFLSYVMDWFVGALFMNLPISLLWLFQTRDMEAVSHLDLWLVKSELGQGQAYLFGCIGIVFALIYFVWIPYKVWPGQTLGKRTMGIEMVNLDGSNLSLGTLCIRQVIGTFLIEGTFYQISGILRALITISTGLNFTGILLYQGLMCSIGSAALCMFYQSHRMLHDYIAKTKVVRVSSKDKEKHHGKY